MLGVWIHHTSESLRYRKWEKPLPLGLLAVISLQGVQEAVPQGAGRLSPLPIRGHMGGGIGPAAPKSLLSQPGVKPEQHQPPGCSWSR